MSDVSKELIRRERSRESLKFYAANIDIPGVPLRADDPECEEFRTVETALAVHHIIMLDALQRTMTKRDGRLMMFFPPGSAKSTYGSVVAPSWYMGRFPGSDLGIYSYASPIAEKQSRRCRSIIRDPVYPSTWEQRATLSSDKSGVESWALSTGSSLMAAGLRAGITGNRLHGAVIDDPTKNREEADSADIQNKNFDEFNDTVMSRLIPGGWVVIIQTLWSELDIPMRLLPEGWAGESGPILCQDGQVWEVLCVPAKCERNDDPLGRKPGEYLWTNWFKPGHWDKWEKNPLARRTWSSLCQQQPMPKEGIQFTRSMFKRFDLNREVSDDGDDRHLPKTLNLYGASDYATLEPDMSRSADPDFTEHGVAGMDWKGDMWFVDWWYGQKETDKGIEAFINKVKAHKARLRAWANEGGLIDHAIGPAVRRSMRENNSYVLIKSFPSIQAKDTKLLAFHARASASTIHIPRCEWGDRLIDQLCMFPALRHDDACDVCGLLGRMIDQMAEAALPKVFVPDPILPYTEKWWEQNSGEQKRKPAYTSRG